MRYMPQRRCERDGTSKPGATGKLSRRSLFRPTDLLHDLRKLLMEKSGPRRK
jgi:hypothetical protein